MSQLEKFQCNTAHAQDPLPFGKSVNVRSILRYTKKALTQVRSPKYKIQLLPPAYVRREGNSFTLFVSPHLGGGVSQLTQPGGSASWGQPAGGGAPAGGGQPAGGVSQLGGGSASRGGQAGGGVSQCTHYTAGGMPLAFTQEDFLVQFYFWDKCIFQLFILKKLFSQTAIVKC